MGVDPVGLGLTTAGLSCSSCGTQLPPDSLFWYKCGAPVTKTTRSAEYKQVTVLFADVVHSMDIAKAVGAERLREMALGVLCRARDAQVRHRNVLTATMADIRIAELTAEGGEPQHAIESARSIVDQLFDHGEMLTRGVATAALVEALLRRGSDTDIQEATAAIERLEAVPTEPEFVMHEIALWRLRTLLAQARGDDSAYRDYRDRYRKMANDLGFEGHIQWAEDMP